jgi:hypothetical protein
MLVTRGRIALGLLLEALARPSTTPGMWFLRQSSAGAERVACGARRLWFSRQSPAGSGRVACSARRLWVLRQSPTRSGGVARNPHSGGSQNPRAARNACDKAGISLGLLLEASARPSITPNLGLESSAEFCDSLQTEKSPNVTPAVTAQRGSAVKPFPFVGSGPRPAMPPDGAGLLPSWLQATKFTP